MSPVPQELARPTVALAIRLSCLLVAWWIVSALPPLKALDFGSAVPFTPLELLHVGVAGTIAFWIFRWSAGIRDLLAGRSPGSQPLPRVLHCLMILYSLKVAYSALADLGVSGYPGSAYRLGSYRAFNWIAFFAMAAPVALAVREVYGSIERLSSPSFWRELAASLLPPPPEG